MFFFFFKDLFTCDISGETSIFGIVRRSVSLEFGGTKMNLTTSGTLFPGIFEGNLQILAVYGSGTGLFFDQLDVSNSFFSNFYTAQKSFPSRVFSLI